MIKVEGTRYGIRTELVPESMKHDIIEMTADGSDLSNMCKLLVSVLDQVASTGRVTVTDDQGFSLIFIIDKAGAKKGAVKICRGELIYGH